MDELKLKLSTRFMRGIVTKIIKKAIVKKLGYQIDIQINELAIENVDGKMYIHANVDAELDNAEFLKIIKDAGMD